MKKILFTLALLVSFNFFGQSKEAINYYNLGGEFYNIMASAEPKPDEMTYDEVYEKSYDYYSKAIEINANYEQAYYFRALLQHNFGSNYYGAISDSSRAIELNPDDSDYFSLRAISKIALKDYKSAIDDYTKAISVNPLNPWYWKGRAELKQKLGNNEGALSDYNISVEMGIYYDKDYKKKYDYRADMIASRALYFYETSNLEAACKDVQKAISLGYKVNEYEKDNSPIRLLFSKCD